MYTVGDCKVPKLEEGHTMKPKLKGGALIGAAMMLLVGTSVCSASPITYAVDQTGIGFDNGSVTGTIETDGTTGTLAASDIINWDLEAVCLGFPSCSASNFNLTGGVGGTYQAADILYYASGGYYVALALYQMWPVTVEGKASTLVWRGDMISSASLASLHGVERLGSESAMVKDISKAVTLFRRDNGGR